MTHATLPGLVIESLANIETQTVQASPGLAALWLAHNAHNRTLSTKTVDQYAHDMSGGTWNFTGQPIIFDSAGHLIDGQHRLTAQVKAGVTLDWLVITGIATATRDFIDIGRARTVGNQLQIKGVGNTGMAAVARLDLIYGGEANPSKPSVRQHAEDNADLFRDGAHIGHSISQVIFGSTAAYGVAFYRLSLIDPGLAQKFFAALLSGADLAETSPVLVARNYIARTRISRSLTDAQRVAFVNYLFKTWNLWQAGKHLKAFSLPVGMVTPIAPRLKRVAA